MGMCQEPFSEDHPKRPFNITKRGSSPHEGFSIKAPHVGRPSNLSDMTTAKPDTYQVLARLQHGPGVGLARVQGVQGVQDVGLSI